MSLHEQTVRFKCWWLHWKHVLGKPHCWWGSVKCTGVFAHYRGPIRRQRSYEGFWWNERCRWMLFLLQSRLLWLCLCFFFCISVTKYNQPAERLHTSLVMEAVNISKIVLTRVQWAMSGTCCWTAEVKNDLRTKIQRANGFIVCDPNLTIVYVCSFFIFIKRNYIILHNVPH